MSSGVYQVDFKAAVKVNDHTFIQNRESCLPLHSSVTRIHVYTSIMLINV